MLSVEAVAGSEQRTHGSSFEEGADGAQRLGDSSLGRGGARAGRKGLARALGIVLEWCAETGPRVSRQGTREGCEKRCAEKCRAGFTGLCSKGSSGSFERERADFGLLVIEFMVFW